MKKYFITGLVILLPLALTIAIVVFILNFLTAPFVGGVREILGYFGLVGKGFLFLSADQLQIVVSKVIILVGLFLVTVLLGALGRWFFVHYFLKIWDFTLHRIPFVSTIYKTSQDVIRTIFASKNNAFKQVVMVPFPSESSHCIGLVTCEAIQGLPESNSENVVAVFVPTTPNPTSGFLMLFKSSDLTYLDMSVEDAFKYVVSCGVIITPFKSLTSEEAHLLSEARESTAKQEQSE